MTINQIGIIVSRKHKVFYCLMDYNSSKPFYTFFNSDSLASTTVNPQVDASSRSLDHRSRFEVVLKQNRDNTVQIRNHRPVMRDQQITKITEIQLEDRVVKIIDTYNAIPFQTQANQQAGSRSQQSNKPNVQRHTRILNNWNTMQANNQQNGSIKKKDTKNVVKNIYKLFLSWVESNVAPQLRVGQLLKSLHRAHGKFNNALIIKISHNDELRKYFINFSDEEGQDLIRSSRIQDKETHLEALLSYHKICYKAKQLENSHQGSAPSENEAKVEQTEQKPNNNQDNKPSVIQTNIDMSNKSTKQQRDP